MAEDKNKQEPLGGPYMVQDRDHLGDPGQMGGDANRGSRQSDQSHSGDRQQGDQNGSPSQKRKGKAK